MHYAVETINTALLEAVLGGQITLDEAKALLARMQAKRRRGLMGIVICAGVFALSCLIYMLVVKFVARPPDTVMLGLLAALFISFMAAAFTLNSFNLARKYLKALKQGYPQAF
jgi:hypothetical protein